MSLIKLGSISTTVTGSDEPNFYLASVIHSQSGFPYPKLISKVTDLDAYYDNDFPYYNMYRDLLNKEIPILIVPVITAESEFNLCSLRLSSDPDFTVSHPVINYVYEYQEPDIELLGEDKDQYTYGIVLDFTNVNSATATDYIIFNGDCIDEFIPGKLVSSKNFMLWFGDKDVDRVPTTRTEFKASLSLSNTIYSTDGGLTIDKPLFIKSIKDKLNDGTSLTVRDIDDILLQGKVIDPVTQENISELPEGIVNFYLENNPVEFTYEEYRYEALQYEGTEYSYEFNSYEDYLKYNREEYLKEFELYILNSDYGVINKSILANEILRIFRDKIFITEYESFTDIDLMISIFETEWSNSSVRSDSMNKLLVEYMGKPGKKVNTSNLDGLIYEDYSVKTEDVKCSVTQGTRLLEFYSKVKGDTGSNIVIDIKKSSLYRDNDRLYYEITITKGSYQEYYQVDLNLDPYKIKFTQDYETPEFREIEILNTSKLVNVLIFDFKVNDELRIQARDYDKYVDIDYWDTGYDRIKELPEGQFYLSRSVTEVPDYLDEIDSYKLINHYEYHPDLILVDNLISYTDTECRSILDCIEDLVMDTSSQALIELPEFIVDSLQSSNKFKLSDIESRILYFYGNLTIDRIIYATYYPYITNIINSDYIRRVSDKIIYLNNFDEDLLDDNNINYLLYNNLYYNYNRFKELSRDPDFIIRFNTSKITRVFMDHIDELINCEYTEFRNKIESLVETCTNLLPLVSYLTYNIVTDNSNKRTIELTVQIKSLTNKTFILNINLNL